MSPRRLPSICLPFTLGVLYLSAAAVTQDTLVVTDTEAISSPSAAAVYESGANRFVAVASRDTDSLTVYGLGSDDTLTPIASTQTGDAPLGLAIGQLGAGLRPAIFSDTAFTANSRSNDISVVGIRSDGVPVERGRFPSGGINPTDVAVSDDDLLFVTNRGALTGEGEGVAVFGVGSDGSLSQIGGLIPTGPQPSVLPSGNDPHIVVVGRGGLTAVADSASNSVTMIRFDRQGRRISVRDFPVGGSPQALSMARNSVFVGIRAAIFGQAQDQIEEYALTGDGGLALQNRTEAGWFLTDLIAREPDSLFAATFSTPAGPPEVREYGISRPGDFNPKASVQFQAPLGFQKLASYPDNGPSESVVVAQFQANRVLHVKRFRQ